MDYKVILGIVAIIIGLVGYVPYFRNIFLRKTKPHAFSWLVWTILTWTAFFVQIFSGAGPGAWVTGFTGVLCTTVFFLSLKYGEKDIHRSDWLSLFGAGIAMLLWALAKQPFLSILVITIIDALGFFPTFRKSYSKPMEETVTTYAFQGIKFIPALFALETHTPTTVLYPAYLVFANLSFVAMVLMRRKQQAILYR